MSRAGTNPHCPDLNMASGRFPRCPGGISKTAPSPPPGAVTFRWSSPHTLEFLGHLFLRRRLFTAMNSPDVLLRLDLGTVFPLAHFIREAPPRLHPTRPAVNA